MIWVNKSQIARQIVQMGERYLFVGCQFIYHPLWEGVKKIIKRIWKIDLLVVAYEHEKDQCPKLEMILTGDFNR